MVKLNILTSTFIFLWLCYSFPGGVNGYKCYMCTYMKDVMGPSCREPPKPENAPAVTNYTGAGSAIPGKETAKYRFKRQAPGAPQMEPTPEPEPTTIGPKEVDVTELPTKERSKIKEFAKDTLGVDIEIPDVLAVVDNLGGMECKGCIKILAWDLIIRACAPSLPGQTACLSYTKDNFDGAICYCQGDYCNKSAGKQYSIIMLIGSMCMLLTTVKALSY